MANNNVINDDNAKQNGLQTETKPQQLPKYSIANRTVLFQENINSLSEYEQHDKKVINNLRKSVDDFSVIHFIYSFIPLVKWLPKYSFKKSFVGDLTAGITVAVMHIPQGMAYGLLAGVTPSSGLYMAFFPTLVYFVFGTSRHISVGTLSVISLMTLKVVQTYSTLGMDHLSVTNTTNATDSLNEDLQPAAVDLYTPMQVVTATAFMVGIHQIIMCFFRMGTLASLLSEPLINGFTTGAAVHVTISQLKDLFGVKIPSHKGAFKTIYTVIDWANSLPASNVNTVIISLVMVIFMIFMNEIVKPKTAKLCRFPVPAELIAVVGGTLASFFLGFGANYNVKLVGHIPLGLPAPEMPPIKLLGMVAVDSIAIAIVSYSVTISMAMIFAKKRNYDISANQELLAMGFSNVVGGLFSCVPNATSLSRSLIQEQTGGNTQMASVVSASLILVILLWIGPFFEVLPRCVLSSIIIVALKGMYMQATALKRYYREGKLEWITWIVTFTAVVLVDVDIGLVCGLVVSLAALHIKGWKSQSYLLGNVDETDVYVDLSTHKKAKEIPFVKMFRYIGAINFASRASFKKDLYETININYKKIRSASVSPTATNDESKNLLTSNFLIIDLSAVSHLDIAGFKTLVEIQKEIKLFDTILLLTCPNDRVFDAINHAGALGEGSIIVLPTINDAVSYAKAKHQENV